MYQVPASRSSVVQFVMTCPGMSHSSTFTLHMRDNGAIDDNKSWKKLCREKKVNIAYNNEPGNFEVDEEKGVLKTFPYLKSSLSISWNYEILESFFRRHHIVPTWLNSNYDWGTFDQKLGRWSGAVGKVLRFFSI